MRKAGTPPGLPTWVEEAQALEPSCAACPGMSAGVELQGLELTLKWEASYAGNSFAH